MNIFEIFDTDIDFDEINEAARDTRSAKTDFKEVPVGRYEVSIDNMGVKPTKNGDKLMLTAAFRIVEGPYTNRLIFMNQILNQNTLPIAIRFLRSLKSDVEVKYDGIENFMSTVLDVLDSISNKKLEYLLDYKENDRGFKVFDIKDVFEC